MIRALIPTIQQTKSNNRRISGSVLHGQVVATRVSGGVDSGRDATFEPTWEVIRQETLDEPGTLQESLSGVPLSFESQTLYRLREVRVVDGGDYSQRPRLRVLDADQTLSRRDLTANVAGETLTSVTVEDSGGLLPAGQGRRVPCAALVLRRLRMCAAAAAAHTGSPTARPPSRSGSATRSCWRSPTEPK